MLSQTIYSVEAAIRIATIMAPVRVNSAVGFYSPNTSVTPDDPATELNRLITRDHNPVAES